jgi:uncharacterized protein YkwD
MERMKYRIPLLAIVAAFLFAGIAASSAEASTGYRWRLFLRINETRVAHGLHRVYLSTGLRSAAQRHSNDMAANHYFAHTSPTGSTLYSRIVASPFERIGEWWAGETLAWGTGTYATPRAVVRGWLNSPTHRAILLSDQYTWIGIGRAVGSYDGHSNVAFWTADWAHR